MTALIIPERLEELKSIQLASGSHRSVEDGMCAMEAASYIAGEPFTDHPSCSCPVITAFLISWNDSIKDAGERTRIIMPLIPLTINTRSTKEIENRRAFMCMDWSIRVFTPDWLDMCHSRHAVHTASLRLLPEIVDWQGIINATPILVDLRKQASAAWDAAWCAARDAAWRAAWCAAWDAAWCAARCAASDAARCAAWDALKPIKEKLQASAADLVRRMCELKIED